MKTALPRVVASCLLCGVFSLTLTACGGGAGGGSSDPTVNRVQEAQKAYDAAVLEEKAAEQALADVIRTRDEDAASLSEAKASQSSLENAVNTALKEQQAGEKLYQKRQQETETAEASLKQLNADQKELRLYKNSSLGFFIWNAPDSGADIETMKKYFLGQVPGSHEAVPNLNNSTDAASYKNFKESIQWLDKGNEMRRRENKSEGTNLKDLTVTDFAMAVSELHADYSKSIIAHHANSGQCAFNMGEDLAWGDRGNGDGPFEHWYTLEKETYQKDPTNKNNDPNWYNSVGHYLNIVSPYYETSGFAINTDPDCLYGKVYAYGFGLDSHGEKTYTVEQYRARISAYETYLRQMDTELNKAQRAVSSAEANEQSAQTDLARLEQNVTNAETAKQDNENKIETLTQKAPKNEQAVKDAQADVAAKQAAVTSAKKELDDAIQALKDAAASSEAAKTAEAA